MLETNRLILRPWRDSDVAEFAALNADPEVMRYFPAPMTRAQSDALADRIRTDMAARGWGLWAVEIVDGAPFIGFVGLNLAVFEAHFTPAVEVGWRLARTAWGHGYATEAARAAVTHGFETVGCDEIVSLTGRINAPSRRVMERLGMTHDPGDDFEHPNVAPGSPLRQHVLYRLRYSAAISAQPSETPTRRSDPRLRSPPAEGGHMVVQRPDADQAHGWSLAGSTNVCLHTRDSFGWFFSRETAGGVTGCSWSKEQAGA